MEKKDCDRKREKEGEEDKVRDKEREGKDRKKK